MAKSKPKAAEWTTVHPLFGPHAIESVDCWCEPIVLIPCTECDERSKGPPESCWACKGKRWVVCEDPEHYDGPHGPILVHSDHGQEKARLAE